MADRLDGEFENGGKAVSFILAWLSGFFAGYTVGVFFWGVIPYWKKRRSALRKGA